jgi:hypothetical protein
VDKHKEEKSLVISLRSIKMEQVPAIQATEVRPEEDSNLYVLKHLKREIEEEEKQAYADDFPSRTFSNHDLSLSKAFKKSFKQMQKPSFIESGGGKSRVNN